MAICGHPQLKYRRAIDVIRDDRTEDVITIFNRLDADAYVYWLGISVLNRRDSRSSVIQCASIETRAAVQIECLSARAR